MGVTSYAARYAQRRLARKMVRVMPMLGVLVVIGTVAAAIRRKGVINGTVDTALDLTPFVGFVKNAVEAFQRIAASPMTFMHQGKQYIVVAAGQGSNTQLIALKLP